MSADQPDVFAEAPGDDYLVENGVDAPLAPLPGRVSHRLTSIAGTLVALCDRGGEPVGANCLQGCNTGVD